MYSFIIFGCENFVLAFLKCIVHSYFRSPDYAVATQSCFFLFHCYWWTLPRLSSLHLLQLRFWLKVSRKAFIAGFGRDSLCGCHRIVMPVSGVSTLNLNMLLSPLLGKMWVNMYPQVRVRQLSIDFKGLRAFQWKLWCIIVILTSIFFLKCKKKKKQYLPVS